MSPPPTPPRCSSSPTRHASSHAASLQAPPCSPASSLGPVTPNRPSPARHSIRSRKSPDRRNLSSHPWERFRPRPWPPREHPDSPHPHCPPRLSSITRLHATLANSDQNRPFVPIFTPITSTSNPSPQRHISTIALVSHLIILPSHQQNQFSSHPYPPRRPTVITAHPIYHRLYGTITAPYPTTTAVTRTPLPHVPLVLR